MNNSSIVNFCQPNGSGMSPCSRAHLSYEKQKECSFCTGKSTGGAYCISQVFGEFCGRMPAQKHSLGQPIMMTDINQGSEIEIEEYHVDSLQISEMEQLLDEMLDPLDYQMPFRDDDGRIRILKNRHDHHPVDPCIKCSKELPDIECDSGKVPCYMKRKHTTMMGWDNSGSMSTLEFHEACHKMVQEQSKIGDIHNHNNNYPAHCIDHNHKMVDHYHGSSEQYALTFTDHEKRSRDEALSFRSETINYIYSRDISFSTIMERYQAGHMKVISAEDMQKLVSTIKTKARLFDTEHLVFYDQNGKLVFDESLDYLYYKQPNWRVLIPAAAIPKSRDYVQYTQYTSKGDLVDFGFRRTARANWPIDTRFPKKDVCKDCAVGYKFCKHQCAEYYYVS